MPGGQDPDQLVQRFMSLSREECDKNERDLISPWPNTYTFTKFLAENVVKKRHGHVKTLIFRPSIVINAEKEPVLGWTENISAVQGMVFGCAIGLVNYMHCSKEMIIDVIPCDYVVN